MKYKEPFKSLLLFVWQLAGTGTYLESERYLMAALCFVGVLAWLILAYLEFGEIKHEH